LAEAKGMPPDEPPPPPIPFLQNPKRYIAKRKGQRLKSRTGFVCFNSCCALFTILILTYFQVNPWLIAWSFIASWIGAATLVVLDQYALNSAGRVGVVRSYGATSGTCCPLRVARSLSLVIKSIP
jgi:hypothetical protein